jgi:hypothetical protein
MDILNFVKTKLDECNLAQLEDISILTNVPMPTIIKIKYNQTPNPGIKTIQPLLTYFQKRMKKVA